jgi:hypothetical protein
MQPLPDLSAATHFPWPESSWVEYKESLSKCIQLKVRDTICAFLNTGGGYIVIGVRDSDRFILGVESDKVADTFQLRLDDIYHQGIIVKEDGSPLPIGTVTVATVPTATKSLLIATVRPELGVTYRMKDGTRWYRLNASNYRLTMENTLLTNEEVAAKIKAAVKEARIEKQREVDRIRTKLTEIQKDFLAVAGAAKEVERKADRLAKELQEVQQALFDTILQKKEEVEVQLEAVPWWKRLCC